MRPDGDNFLVSALKVPGKARPEDPIASAASGDAGVRLDQSMVNPELKKSMF